MRNLKKFLALVLAMVMAFSLMLSASAATSLSGFQDADKVTPEFVESVTILAGLDVLKGDGDEDNKTIRPQDEITRAEAAALVYRVVTGDVNDRQVQLYSDYGKFADVNSSDWFAGYVGYCQNAGIIKGTTPTTFSPYLKVTGYEVLAMILRAVGYGKNNEFTGSSWQVNVASLGKTKHITDSISSAQYNYTLNMNARREIVAELLFRGAMIPQVTWTAIGGYNEYDSLLGSGVGTQNDSLMSEVFALDREGWRYGSWGRPELVWTAGLNPTSTPRREVAVLPAAASYSFTDLKRECDVAEMLEIKTSDTFVLFVDAAKRTATNPITVADDAVTNAYKIVATDTVTKVGGYGRLTEIYLQDDMDKQYPYYSYWTYWSTDKGSNPNGPQRTALADTFVMIDTYLAEVIATADVVLDPAGHVITPARMTVDLYDRDQNLTLRRIIEKPSGSKVNWEYSAGDVLSLKGVSTQVNTEIPTGQSDSEAWAFTLPRVNVNTKTNGTEVLVQNTHVFDITKLNGTQGKQTTVYWNNGKHQVDGQDQTDALALRMDKAGNNINTTYTWYYDVKDNGESYLLGIGNAGKVNYGVITSVYVSYGTTEAVDTDGVAKAVATVRYADGTTGTETIDYFMVSGTTAGTRPTITGAAISHMTSTDNTVQLYPVYNVASNDPMKEQAGTAFNAGDVSSAVCATKGVVFMAPVAATNTAAAAKNSYADNNKHGILNDNLFKFVKTAGDKTVAIEVAGGNNTDSSNNVGTPVSDSTAADFTARSGNTGDFAGHWNVVATSSPKLYKSRAYITRDGGTSADSVVTWLDEETQIMVRNPSNGAITCYDGVSALPGDVSIAVSGTVATAANRKMDEIDWADTDNDGRAEVVYLTGTIEGVTTYGLFYTNALTSTWNGTTGTIHGFWNGEETDLTFTSLGLFNQVKNAYNDNADAYNGHLFAIKQIGGVVADVLVKNDTNYVEELLYDVGAGNTSGESFPLYSGAAATLLSSATNAPDWHFGTDSGYNGVNPYSAATKAVYWTDDSATPVVYNASSNWDLIGATVTVGDPVTDTYRLTPNSKVYGIGSNVVLAEGVTALEYLNHSVINHVTIVYDEANDTNSRSVLEMYIQTDPNITPTTSATYTLSGNVTNLTTTSSTTLGDTLANGTPNTVVYSPNAKNPAGLVGNPLDSSEPAGNLLYFPYVASPDTYTLYIYDTANSLIYRESTSGSVSTNGMVGPGHATGNPNAHCFVIDITGRTNTGVGVGLARGDTYTFRIMSSTGTQVSRGSFTLK